VKTRTILFVVVCMLVLASSPAHTQSSSQGVWVYATQYNANTVYPYGNGFNGHIQVALPDKYVKFCIIYKSCYSNYPAGRSYTINFYDGKYNVSYLGVGEVGPWNVDDNYWDPAMNWPRPRRLFRDLSQGTPEAYMAVVTGYNSGRDQFGRVIQTRPYGPGLDVSTAAAGWLGWPYLSNRWVYIRVYNWDY